LLNVVKWRKYSPVKFANFVYICITRRKNNHFRLKNGYFSRALNANIYKICELHSSIFSSFYNNSRPNFAILLILDALSSYGNGFVLLVWIKISFIAGIIRSILWHAQLHVVIQPRFIPTQNGRAVWTQNWHNPYFDDVLCTRFTSWPDFSISRENIPHFQTEYINQR
jgi:hypothetical protein